MIFPKPIKTFFKIFMLFLSPIILYISVAFGLTLFPTKTLTMGKKNQTIYILYNQFHCDIVLNIEEISNQKFKELYLISEKRKGYIAFGWGDKETYLNTPTWEEIELSTSLKALFLNTPSLMHITYYRDINRFEGIKNITVSKEQKVRLETSLLKSFSPNKKSHRGYGSNDYFYDSPYIYNFIFTCNTWVGERLKDADISVSLWTPLSYNIIYSLP